MPQACDGMRDLMEKWFGDPVDDAGPTNFLESRGYKLRPDWHWEPPVRFHTVRDEEEMCILFLHDEWDFGYLVEWEGKCANTMVYPGP